MFAGWLCINRFQPKQVEKDTNNLIKLTKKGEVMISMEPKWSRGYCKRN